MKPYHDEKFSTIDDVIRGFKPCGYITSRQIATTVYLAYQLCKPVLVEGPAGVGKTELAKTVSAYLDVPLIRLQCYEGLDESKALYEWKYGKQLLYTQLLRDKLDSIIQKRNGLEDSMKKLHQYDDVFFSMDFLEPRPLLRALREPRGAVLLIDEVDKSDDEFEAFLLEVLSEYQVSIPEIGTISALTKPFVFLTSNNTRELSEALKRRCLHLYIPFPDQELEREIIRVKVPGISETLEEQLVAFIHEVRKLDIKKVPSISESIDWARVLLILHANRLSYELIHDTLNTFVKFEEDVRLVRDELRGLADRVVNAR